MGYCPCFLAKNDPKCMFFASAKIIENNLKGVKMTQNRSKPLYTFSVSYFIQRYSLAQLLKSFFLHRLLSTLMYSI
jgi:hypothetical protein